MKRALLAAMLGCCALAQGATNSPTRVQAFAKLPDWTGYWDTEWIQSVTNPSGRGDDLSYRSVAAHARLASAPPYNAEWQARYVAALGGAAQAGSNRKQCDWRDFPLIMEAPTTMQFQITPEETLIAFHLGVVRHVFTDGRKHPGADDLWPTKLGHSIGHWEGETLVIDTIARTAGPVFVGPSAELSDDARIVERLRRVDRNTLENRMTITDAARFTKPWELTIRYNRAVGLDRMIDWNCEDDRHPVIDGKLQLTPP
jgi:hypothetical protein